MPGSFRASLSRKLLLLTLAAVMLAEVFIFVPSVANFRLSWLTDRLVAAQIASIAADAAPGGALQDTLRDELLNTVQVNSIAYRSDEKRRMIAREGTASVIAEFYDLTKANQIQLVADALRVFVSAKERVIAVRGNPGLAKAEFVEIAFPEASLRKAMVAYGLNILGLSIVISLFTAGLVYIALNAMLVRPMRDMMRNMVRFSEDPEDPRRIIHPSGREDEIGRAEEELASMQGQLHHLLQEKSRLAALGLAVSKVNHDLRNMLANAQLISDQFETVEHPIVRRFAPKLIGSLDRAIRLCTETLRFGQAREAPPKMVRFKLRALAEEVAETLGLPRPGEIALDLDVPANLEINADRDQFFRVLSNLMRNATEALDGIAPGRGNTTERITVTASESDEATRIVIADSGPGVPEKARKVLFQAFQGSARRGGSGLGLAISAELVRDHGGTIALVDTNTGAAFEIVLPRTADAANPAHAAA